MHTCAYCKNVFYDTPYRFRSVRGSPDYADAFSSAAFDLEFCSDSCLTAWKNEWNENWQQKKAAEEAERAAYRAESERRKDEQERSEHTLRCDQCGRELPAVRDIHGSGDWCYPSHWNAQGAADFGIQCQQRFLEYRWRRRVLLVRMLQCSEGRRAC